ncbi:MAG: ATP-dependent DNA helicase RecG [Ruminococcaceae bacterium]|nr:ATP-dependent DNA helicase RecG [Oscillospiraceae bacterium]
MNTNADIKKLYGVGEVKAKAYSRMGVNTIGDLLEHYPRGYENRGDVILLSEADGIGKRAHILTVATEPKSVRLKNRMSLLKFRAYDDSGVCDITFFNQDFLKNSFPIGSSFRFYGKVERVGNRYSMASPAYEAWNEESELPPLVPVYPLTEGISQKQIAKDMRSALIVATYADNEDDPLPSEIRHRHSLCTRSFAIKNIHSPDNFTSLAAAKKRLIFDEFFTFALGLGLAGGKSAPPPAYPCENNDITPLLKLLPYELTGAQKRTIKEISDDMSKPYAMSRMVVGDVGCGKTVCAAAAILIAIQSGKQAALMAPTEILARQHYADLKNWFDALGIRVSLLVGALGAAEKRRVHASLSETDPQKRTDVVIGTQALLSEGVGFSSLGLVVADEQHRFGVGQRANLSSKGEMSHTLVMSATPIPRSLALSIYGDLDVSRIDEMPAGRQRVDTYVVDESYRERLNGFIRKQTDDGGQVYVVCPAVEEIEDEETDLSLGDIDENGEIREKGTPLKSAVEFSDELARIFPDLKVAFLHGKMKSKDKDAIMQSFADGEVHILVSTTVIEVGVNVPNASLMIVENADRFGLSQLHQLRGRVGRGARKSYCVLVSDFAKKEGKANERLKIMKNSYDGYDIAERDLAMRGPGDFLRGTADSGVRQSGGVKFKLAELCEDTGLLSAAFDEARALLATDPELAEHSALCDIVKKTFTLDRGTVN